jgi:hypothetical protein
MTAELILSLQKAVDFFDSACEQLASRIDVSVSEDERIYYNGKLNDNTAMYIWNGITMERIC